MKDFLVMEDFYSVLVLVLLPMGFLESEKTRSVYLWRH